MGENGVLFIFLYICYPSRDCQLYIILDLTVLGPVITRWSFRHSVGWEVVSGSFPESYKLDFLLLLLHKFHKNLTGKRTIWGRSKSIIPLKFMECNIVHSCMIGRKRRGFVMPYQCHTNAFQIRWGWWILPIKSQMVMEQQLQRCQTRRKCISLICCSQRSILSPGRRVLGSKSGSITRKEHASQAWSSKLRQNWGQCSSFHRGKTLFIFLGSWWKFWTLSSSRLAFPISPIAFMMVLLLILKLREYSLWKSLYSSSSQRWGFNASGLDLSAKRNLQYAIADGIQCWTPKGIEDQVPVPSPLVL